MHSCVTSKNVKWCHLIWPTLYIIRYEQFRLFAPESLVLARRGKLVQCSVGLDLRPAVPACCCSCFRQPLLSILAIACSPLDAGLTDIMTDRHNRPILRTERPPLCKEITERFCGRPHRWPQVLQPSYQPKKKLIAFIM